MFHDTLERKSAFQGFKNMNLKKSKNCDFSEGVSPWFWSKIGNFFIFLFKEKKKQENVFYDIVKRKNNFLGYKNEKFKKSKNWDFSKEVTPWLRSKICNFFIFLFKAN